MSVKNNLIHNLFAATIFMKGLNSLWEIAVGLLFLVFKRETIHNALVIFTHEKIISETGPAASRYLIGQANNFSASTQYFIAFYFLFYGIVNMFLVFSLLKGKLWAYPAAIVFFITFTAYMGYRFFMHHSGVLLFFIIFDLFLILLTWMEYGRVRKSLEYLG